MSESVLGLRQKLKKSAPKSEPLHMATARENEAQSAIFALRVQGKGLTSPRAIEFRGVLGAAPCAQVPAEADPLLKLTSKGSLDLRRAVPVEYSLIRSHPIGLTCNCLSLFFNSSSSSPGAPIAQSAPPASPAACAADPSPPASAARRSAWPTRAAAARSPSSFQDIKKELRKLSRRELRDIVRSFSSST